MAELPAVSFATLPLDITDYILNLVEDPLTANALALTSKDLYVAERACRTKLVLRYDDISTKSTARRLRDSFPGVRRIVIKRNGGSRMARRRTSAKSRGVIKNGLLDGMSIARLDMHNIPRGELRSLCTESDHLENLWHLNLSNCSELSDRTLESLLRVLPRLRVLDISRCEMLSMDSILVALRHPTLVELIATHITVSTKHPVLGMEVSPNIRRLNFAKSAIPHDLLLVVLGLTTALEVLDLSFYQEQSSDILHAVSELGSLRELRLDAWNTEGIDFSHIKHMRGLRTLSLSTCWRFDSVRHLLPLVELRFLDLSHCRVSRDELLLLMNEMRAPELCLQIWELSRANATGVVQTLLGNSDLMYHSEECSQHDNMLVFTFLWTDKIRLLHINYPKDSTPRIKTIGTLHNAWAT